MFRRLTTAILGVTLLAMAGHAAPAKAAPILLIDVTDPDRLIFTSTDAFATTGATIGRGAGISLLDFFTSPTPFVNPGAEPGSSFRDSINPGARALDGGFARPNFRLFNIFTSGPDLEFFTTQRALTGQVIFNLPAVLDAVLPRPGASGDIGLGSIPSTFSTTIGQWQVIGPVSVAVPEPGSLALLGIGLIGLAALRREKRA